MIKLILMLKRREGMSFEEFKAYYEMRHAVLAVRLMPKESKVLRYQRRFLCPMGNPVGDAGGVDYDCITEMWFADRTAMEAAMAHAADPETAKVIAEDEERLFDRSKIRYYIVESECMTE